jgi:hypothetical protein
VKNSWWTWTEGKRVELYTNQPPTIKEPRPSLIAGNTVDSLVFLDWINFREFGDYYIERGKTLPFNVAFMFDISEEEIKNSSKWQFIVTDYFNEEYATTISNPTFLSLSTKNNVLFDCYIKDPRDVQELLKDRTLDLKTIQTFLISKYNHRESWYD